MPLVHKALVAAGRKLAKRHVAYVPDVGSRILSRYLSVAAEMDTGPRTILHGDPHPGNVYFIDPGEDAAGGAHQAPLGGLFDWQVLRQGNGVRDLAYFVILSLEPEVRQAHMDELVDRYREELEAAGGPGLRAADVLLDMRRMAAYAYTSAAFTAAFGGLQAERVALGGLRRAAAAVVDLDTGSVLESLR